MSKQQTGSKSQDRASGFGKFSINNRTGVSSRTSFASVVYFHYEHQNLFNPLAKTRDMGGRVSDVSAVKGTIVSEITSVRVSKSLQSASTFEISLLPSKNWKVTISPGDWLIIYMFDKESSKAVGSKNIIMIGNVDRVSRSLQNDKETGKTLLRYVISGRGTQKVFEGTDLWFNPYLSGEKEVDRLLRDAGLNLVGNPSTMVKELVNIFLGNGGTTAKGKTSPLNMWHLPPDLASHLNMNSNTVDPALTDIRQSISAGLKGQAPTDKAAAGATSSASTSRFFDILRLYVDDNLPGYKPSQLLTTDSNGSLHEMLGRCSNSLINEIFYEDVRDENGEVRPTLVLRPRPVSSPYFINRKPYTSAIGDHWTSLNALSRISFVEILPSEVTSEDLGKDDHSKFNFWWLRTSNGYEITHNATADKQEMPGARNPTLVGSSMQRDGLRRFDQMLEFGTGSASGASITTDVRLWQGFMEQLIDFHAYNHLYESGTLECTGVMEAELGKALIIKDLTNSINNKIYYIEGYEHNWQFPGTWRTTFTLTHGQWQQSGGDNTFIDVALHDGGHPDTMLDKTYLAQTNVGKK